MIVQYANRCFVGVVDIVAWIYIVNSVLAPDDRVTQVVAGHYQKAQRQGVQFARRVYSKRIQEQVDILLSVSYSHDIDFWQAAKGIYGPEKTSQGRRHIAAGSSLS